jgi:hypothetical protein
MYVGNTIGEKSLTAIIKISDNCKDIDVKIRLVVRFKILSENLSFKSLRCSKILMKRKRKKNIEKSV